MKMLVPELSPATVFWSQIEKKNRKCDIGEAQRDPCVLWCALQSKYYLKTDFILCFV